MDLSSYLDWDLVDLYDFGGNLGDFDQFGCDFVNLMHLDGDFDHIVLWLAVFYDFEAFCEFYGGLFFGVVGDVV